MFAIALGAWIGSSAAAGLAWAIVARNLETFDIY